MVLRLSDQVHVEQVHCNYILNRHTLNIGVSTRYIGVRDTFNYVVEQTLGRDDRESKQHT